jgi:tetratricopeptide (TPR) repeat protein
MTPEERKGLERNAERSLRRGELRDAVASFRTLADAFPGDEALAGRLALVEETLQPAELAGAMASARSDPSGTHRSPTHQAEAQAARGDFKGAIAIYEELLQQTPQADLLRDRLGELRQLAAATRAHPALSREHLLEHLLERISSRRRAP